MSRWFGRVGSGGAGSSFGNIVVGGVGYFAAGAVSTPSVSVGEADTGLYLAAADTLAIASSGYKYLSFNSAISSFNSSIFPVGVDKTIGNAGNKWLDLHLGGVAYFADGSQSAPSITFGSDTNTGFLTNGLVVC